MGWAGGSRHRESESGEREDEVTKGYGITRKGLERTRGLGSQEECFPCVGGDVERW